MERIPISLLVDDACPLVHVYRYHWEDVHDKPPLTKDGRRLLDTVPNAFLDRFCDVMARHGMRGKLSIVPAPAGRGDIVQGIEGHDPALTVEWLDTARRRLGGLCDFCPEGITHNLALDVPSGRSIGESENDWSQHQTRDTLTPYLVRELELLKAAGIDATGFTSPWVFGIEVEPEYVASMVEAQRAVYGREFSWYFLHMLWERPATRPWVAYHQGSTTLVSIPATVADWWWETIDCPRQDPGYAHEIADHMLSADGCSGQIVEVLDAGGWPMLLTHWQSLFSNGLETGLAALDEVARRVGSLLGDRVQWMTCSEVAQKTAEGEGARA